MRRVPAVSICLVLLELTSGPSGAVLSAQRPGSAPSVAQVRADYTARAYNAEYDPAAIQDALKAAGATSQQMDEILKDILRVVDKAKARGRNAGADQNASGTGDWNLGGIFRGQTYNLAFPLTNQCRVPQTVTIAYPGTIDLTGPETVLVPPKSTIDVPLVLKAAEPNFIGPVPLGLNLSCIDVTGEISMTHPELRREESTPAGKYTYVCHESKVTYDVKLHIHAPPPDPPGGGGGGGGGDRKTSKACETYWRTGEFFPDKEHPSPDACRNDLEELSAEMLVNEIAPLQAQHDPGMFAWLPKGVDPAKLASKADARSALKGLSSEEMADLRRKADNAVRMIDCSQWIDPNACAGGASLNGGRP
ncbi:MAG: hypothetical protein IT176_04445 [Acidobacteria bacterium]|nr:hypothetical protein [Acidobacteriota bacterium]